MLNRKSVDWSIRYTGIIFNNEFIFKNERNDFIYSPQVSVFYSGPTLLTIYGGLKFSYYTNFKNGGNFIIAPEVGFGVAGLISLIYGRNISIVDNNLIPVNKNNLSLKLLIQLSDLY